jgi:uncharacterized protein (TIGR03435 family)
MRIRTFIALAVLVGIVVAATGVAREPVLHAQASARKAFATVSVKRSEEFINPNPTVENGRFVWRAAPLVLMVGFAYDASAPTIEGKIPVEPMYDIDATFAPSATPREVQEMLKNLLIDTFALRVHTEARTMSFFRLVPEAGGHKLRPGARRPLSPAFAAPGPGRHRSRALARDRARRVDRAPEAARGDPLAEAQLDG